ncbi:MAG TPA: WecB/TagA/CpsF family glycosyltransferase [Terriglobales bacterium]|jgi:N-acetylglucosaminyldiphosphoundecaprenol N-acetyl-beta-D-mannosaminyltransferase
MACRIVIPKSGEVTLPTFRVLGMSVSPLQIPEILQVIDHWIQERDCSRYIIQMGMHGMIEAMKDPKLREIINAADLKNMDGMPMKWLARIHGFKNAHRRAYGPEVMGTLLRETGAKYRHFFYGHRASEELAVTCERKYGTRVAGTYPLAVWPLPESEKQILARAIESAAPDIVWVGLGTPRQDQFMYEFRNRLTVPVMIGVGAAFDFHTGKLKQAPVWMQENGFEWLYRLVHEPRRLWRRYLVCGPIFVWNVGLELVGLKKFD